MRVLEGRNLVEPLSRVGVTRVLTDQLWVAGGIDSGGEPSWQVQYLDTAQWFSAATLRTPRAGAGFVTLYSTSANGRDAGLLVIGGESHGVPLGSVERLGGAQGASCTTGAECRSGFCAQGVCCNEACDGECRTCVAVSSGPGGVCHDVPLGEPSPQGCKRDPDLPCAVSKLCDGNGACLPVPEGEDCGSTCGLGLLHRKVCDEAGECVESELHCNGNCDGRTCFAGCSAERPCPDGAHCEQGECVAGATCDFCGPYACDTSTNTCKTACLSLADCSSTAYCSLRTRTCVESTHFPGPARVGCWCRVGEPTPGRGSGLPLIGVALCAFVWRRRATSPRRRR